MVRRTQDLFGRTALDDATRVHDQHTVAKFAYDRQIVADEKVRHRTFTTESYKQFKYDCLDTDVQRGRRLVQDEILGRSQIARAISTRAFSPPESWCGRRFRRAGASPTISASS